jgi:hypothetical protein
MTPDNNDLNRLISRAQALAVAGPLAEAQSVNLQILEVDTSNLSALRRLGKMAKDAGDQDAALAYYRRVLDLEPEDTIARNQLARLHGGPIRSTPQAVKLAEIRATMETLLSDVQFGEPSHTGPVTVPWPAGTEHYPDGWNLVAKAAGRSLPIRHLLGHRVAFGRLRRRTLTLVRDTVEVEGVESNDYARTRGHLSLLRHPDGTHVRSRSELPGGYDGFLVVWHHEEILEPRSPQSLAVKLLEDDLVGWASHALLRAAGRGRLVS